MAYSIAAALDRQPGAKILQINGGFHSNYRLGILDHLQRYRPGTTALVVTMDSDKTFPAWDDAKKNVGDFVIITDPALPRTFGDEPEASKKKHKGKKQKESQK